MNIQRQCLQLILLLISMTMLAGCATPGRGMLPKGGDMTMPEIYKSESGLIQQGYGGSPDSDVSDQSLSGIREGLIGDINHPNYVAYTATAKNEIKHLFKRIPNPEIPFYIFPHLVHADGESFPKPGITSSFFLYRSNHFAMPNEKY